MATPQRPIGSGFGARTTAREACAGVDLRGRVAIVTGGYSGLGLETTRALAEAGATVIVPARTPEKARAALAGLANVEQETLDLADPASIDAFAERFLASGRPLHILINNAAIMAAPLMRDARGYEAQFATNHLGHFHLAARLWPALAKANGARVVSLSSIGHRRAPVNLEDPSFERGAYDKWESYGRAKSANALFAVGLDKRGAPHNVRAFAVHPGGIMTDLQRFMPEEEKRAMGWIDEHGRVNDRFKTPEQGAATSVWCAVSPQLAGMGGVYCEDCDVAQAVPADAQTWSGVRPWAIDPDTADRLWALSERMTGVRFEP
ncbi:MAG: SDR family NAD(P)-dependent oxidoreductase [Hydrogenophilaceae bacterium]|jgi:NAD(P)-dependent dehydrogenase (short-subunit alcohol dehydrogenase family)|nr:SDR family NAD(P)-dependent oxidoreductase [Hydrogenophilaceae bacterium]